MEKITIQGLSHEGRGIAKVNGKTTFIDNALPGETVTLRYLKRHSKYDEAIAETILNHSSDRTTPQCPHFLVCGGCSLQHLENTAQIAFKQTTLLEQLQHFAQVTPEQLLPPLTGPIYGYRRKARLGIRFVAKKNQVLVGFREKNGRYLADISSCPILEPNVSNLIEPLKNMLMQFDGYRDIPQLEIAVGDHETAFVFRHLKLLSEKDQQLLIDFGKKYHLAIYLQPGNLTTTHRIWPETDEDKLHYCFPKHHIELKFHPQDFIQVNATMNQKIADRVIDLLQPNDNDQILDLFCGLGNFTLPIARYCKSITGIEGDSIMVSRAEKNAHHNQLNNTQFFVHNLTTTFAHCAWARKSYSKILLDPPRSGAAEILGDIAALKPTRIVYISCNPSTLARDAGELVHQHGFKLRSAGVMDMFPHTSHVESIAVFE